MLSATRKGIVTSMLVALAALGGCTAEPASDDDDEAECESDSDCRGDRICSAGECVPEQQEGPVCGDGICDAGEEACGDCQSGGVDATLLVQNNTATTVYYLYVSPCWATSWGPDQLGEHVIVGGSSFTLRAITPDCYDLRAEAQSGVYWESPDVSLPAGETFTWTLTP